MTPRHDMAAIRASFPAGIRKRLPTDIRIVMIGEEISRNLNRRYRGKDKPTNVLSFRYGPAYGEVLLCRLVIQREARAERRALHAQMTWMVVHGMLHLAGMHHERSARAAYEFEMTERKILDQLSGERG